MKGQCFVVKPGSFYLPFYLSGADKKWISVATERDLSSEPTIWYVEWGLNGLQEWEL